MYEKIICQPITKIFWNYCLKLYKDKFDEYDLCGKNDLIRLTASYFKQKI